MYDWGYTRWAKVCCVWEFIIHIKAFIAMPSPFIVLGCIQEIFSWRVLPGKDLRTGSSDEIAGAKNEEFITAI